MRIIDGVEVITNRPDNEFYQSEGTPPEATQMSDENLVHIEIVNSTEIPIAHWVYDVENQLAGEGRQQT